MLLLSFHGIDIKNLWLTIFLDGCYTSLGYELICLTASRWRLLFEWMRSSEGKAANRCSPCLRVGLMIFPTGC